MKFILFSLLLTLVGCITTDSKESIIQDKEKCVITSEDFVKQKLKFPDESDFNSSTAIFEKNGDKSTVINKFTTKNAFGTIISGVYKIELLFNGGEWTDLNNWNYGLFQIEFSTGEVKNY